VAGTFGYGEGLSGSINAGNFLTSCKVYWLASEESFSLLHGVNNELKPPCSVTRMYCNIYDREGRLYGFDLDG
jgi:hypothetical protein